MIELILQRLPDIRRACERHGVRRLELFGSAARGDYAPGTSDLDFFVEFADYDAPTLADQWFGLQEDLQRVLATPVELVSTRAATNPYFLAVANRHREVVFVMPFAC
jgi:uncharacterized protein